MKQMNEINQVQDDEIDIFELFQTLWDGKWLISAIVAIAVLLGGGFLLQKDAKYESKLIFSLNTIPPFYKNNKIKTDFRTKFYSVSVFEEWKQNNSNISIKFEDFSTNVVVDGFVLSKNEGQMLATLVSEKRGYSFVLVKSNQIPVLDDFFEYASHINGLLKNEYVVRAKEELKIIEERLKDLTTADNNILDILLPIDRYIISAEKGANVLAIQRPKAPEKVSPNSFFTLALSVVLGGMVGVFFILTRNTIRNRKKQLAEA
ncbi:Wzz/FepE/Etk N-terminal domain-containing protein [Candidatus Levibacter sp. Uisw_134_01]|uniref:Wzz/FepE/Etk N-terminal domain-containing protein n=1 Tax=Candidatus Levibacter sp. Uisw_134_01 TaxID=3230999 RepID=UPI003D442BCB